MQAAAEGAPEGSVFLAEEQLAGRGRGAHSWHSARSAGIYCSVVLRPAMPPSEALIFSMAAGLAVHAAVSSIAPGLQPDLKWPNDVSAGRQEVLRNSHRDECRSHASAPSGDRDRDQRQPGEVSGRVARDCDFAADGNRHRVVAGGAVRRPAKIARPRISRPACGCGSARDSILRRFQENSTTVRGQRVRVEENGGLEGVTEGLDARGFLQVRTAAGVRTVLSGTVRIT